MEVQQFNAKVEADGNLVLPPEVRAQMQLETGGDLIFIRVNGHWLVSPRPLLVYEALDKLNALMEESNASFEELMAKGREIRAHLFEEQYGPRPVA